MMRRLHFGILLAAVALTACEHEQAPVTQDVFEFEKRYFESDKNSVLHSIDEPDLPSVLVTRSGDSIGVGIFQQGTGSPVVSLRDENGDGVFDYIAYSALSPAGLSSATVEDFRMDGTPDFVVYVNNSKPAAKVFVNDEWIEVHGVGAGSPAEPTVEIRGEKKPLGEVLDSLGRP